MRYLLLITVLFFSPAKSAKLIFNNNAEEVNIIGTVVINQSGDILVTPDGNYSIVSESQPVILGFYPSDYEVTAGQQISANWTVVNADSCTATTTSGQSNWSGGKSSSDGNNSTPNISVSQLPATLNMSCSNQYGNNAQASFNVTLQTTTGGGTPSIDLFTLNNQSSIVTVNPPGTINIQWSASDVNGCTASASPAVSGWAGNKPISGNESVTITNNASVSLNCDGILKTVTVNYSEDSNCTNAVYPPGLTRTNSTYPEVSEGFNFGENANTDVTLPISTSSFLSISGFGLNATNFRRRVDFADAPTDQNLMNVATYSVSECPGDFTATSVCTKAISNFSNIQFSTNQSDDPNAFCILESGKSYYLNFVMDQFPYSGPGPSCDTASDSTCSAFYTEIAIQ